MLNVTFPNPVSSILQGGRQSLRRAFWGGMLLLHVAPIQSVSQTIFVQNAVSSGEIARFAMLLGSAAFFVLKIADVSWLRLTPSWRTTVSSLAIVALLHANVLDQAAETPLAYSSGHLVMILTAGSVLGVEALRSSLKRMRTSPSVPPLHTEPPQASVRIDSGWPEAVGPPQWWVQIAHLVPRAPPAI